MPSRFVISSALPADLDRMNDWAAAEGWNPGLADGPAFRAADPDAIVIGRLNGESIAAISAVAYGAAFGFMGFHICRPEFRGKGYGIAVWNAGIRKLGDRVIGLDGVIDQLANYRKSGFVLAYRNVRYGGVAERPPAVDRHVVPVSGALVDAVIEYDRPLFPGPRTAFIQRWLQPDRRAALAYVSDGTVRGYGVVRACRNGHRIAPLFADTNVVADALFVALAGTVAGAPIFLDLPEPNPAAVRLAERYRLAPVFETARMYRGSAPTLPIARTFGITSFELG
jgi:hypothetical protein